MANTNSLAFIRSSAQYAYHADTASLRVDDGWTVEMWFKCTNFSDVPYLAGSRSVENGWGIVCKSGGTIEVRSGNATHDFGTTSITGSKNVNDGNWHHLAAYWNGASSKLYIDGVLDVSGTTNAIDTSNTNVVIGGTWDAGSRDYITGNIDEVRFWNDERTATEIFQNYRKELNGNEQGLQAYWKLNNNTHDSTANGNHLTLVNSPTYTSYVPFTSQTDVFYVIPGDGAVSKYGGTWSENRSASTGSVVMISTNYTTLGYESGVRVYRNYLNFDTSTIGSNSTISNASLHLIPEETGSSNEIGIIQTTQLDPAILAVEDYSRLTLNSPQEGATRQTWGNTVAWITYPLNSTGLSWIDKTSYTKLGLRTDNDIDNVDPGSGDKLTYIGNSRCAGKEPYLEVTYTTTAYVAPTWVAGATLPEAVFGPQGGAGTSIAALILEGRSTAHAFEYNNSAWSAVADIGLVGSYPMVCGASTSAALKFGCWTGTPSVVTEEFNGTSWSYGGDMGAGVYNGTGFGTQDAAVSAGGSPGSKTVCEEYNGTSWSAGGALSTGRNSAGSAGTLTAGLAYGGGAVSSTEEYNGTAWSAGGSLDSNKEFPGGGGTQTAALCSGGHNGSTYVSTTLEYDGSIWSTRNSLITARSFPGSVGTSSSNLVAGGNGGGSDLTSTEEYNTPFDHQRQAIINGLDSAQSEAHGWDVEVKGKIPVTDVARTSDTVATITLSPEAAYNITATETVTATIPTAALVNYDSNIVASPTFDITGGAAGPANVKTFMGLAEASAKTVNGIEIASVKTWNGIA
jgi:hypothetical protein